LFVEGLAHQPQDVGNGVNGNAASFATVEAVECLLEDCNKITKKIELVFFCFVPNPD
jgi:hypothetical protein